MRPASCPRPRLSAPTPCASSKRVAARKKPAKTVATGPAAEAASEPAPRNDDDKRQEALDFIVETIEALATERGEEEKIWGSMVKQTMKRRRPGFNESSYGYRSFRELVDDAQKRKLLTVITDERPGQYQLRLPASED